MGIKTPYICEIAPDTYAINEFGLAALYLLVGEREALLIDTGCGYCDLKGVVSRLTDKPCRVACTHGHMDHVGGMGAFEKIYLNEKDHEMAAKISCEELRSYGDSFGKSGGYEIYDYSPDMAPGAIRIPELLPMKEGDTFELGGRSVEVYQIEGHTAGGCVLLDTKNRILFSGDCCNVNLLAPWCSVERTYRALKKVKALEDRFDQNFNGHVGYAGSPTCLSQPQSVPDDLLHICESILEGKGEPKPYEFLGHAFMQMHYGAAKLSYDPDWLTGDQPVHGPSGIEA